MKINLGGAGAANPADPAQTTKEKVESAGGGTGAEDDPVLARALAMSVDQSEGSAEDKSDVNLDAMTEDEQIGKETRLK